MPVDLGGTVLLSQLMWAGQYRIAMPVDLIRTVLLC